MSTNSNSHVRATRRSRLVSKVNSANHKTAMNPIKTVLRLLLGCLFFILIAYWVVFITFTITLFISGGRDRVIHWYMHISSVGIQFRWSWKEFVARHIANLAITVSLYFLMRRLRDKSKETQ